MRRDLIARKIKQALGRQGQGDLRYVRTRNAGNGAVVVKLGLFAWHGYDKRMAIADTLYAAGLCSAFTHTDGEIVLTVREGR